MVMKQPATLNSVFYLRENILFIYLWTRGL